VLRSTAKSVHLHYTAPKDCIRNKELHGDGDNGKTAVTAVNARKWGKN